MYKLWAFLIALTFVSSIQAVTARSGLKTLLDPEAVTQRRGDADAIPVAFLPDCDLTGVDTVSLFGPFDTWRAHVEQLSPAVRGQIRRLFLDGSHGYLRTDEVNRTLSRTQYLNRGNDEPAIDLSVLELFPSLVEVRFNQVQNFNVTHFTSLRWPNITDFGFCAMRIGQNTNWLRDLDAPNLEVLDLSFNVIGLRQIEAVAPDLHRNCPRLQNIDIGNASEAYREGNYINEHSLVLGRNYTPEVDWVNDFPYYNHDRQGDGVNEEDLERIEVNFGIRVNTRGLYADEQADDDSENESSNSVSHRSASDTVQESGSEN
jgi:hypothetical protein